MADEQTPPEPPPDQTEQTPPADLGDAGRKALAEERSARKAAERAARDATSELEKLRAGALSEQEKAVAQARAEGKAEALKDARERLARSEIKVAAAGKMADPADAVRLLDLDDLISDDGEINEKKVAKAIDDLLKDKPYLAANGRKSDFDGGARTSPPVGDDMSALIRRAAGRA